MRSGYENVFGPEVFPENEVVEDAGSPTSSARGWAGESTTRDYRGPVGIPVIMLTQAVYHSALEVLNQHVPEACGLLLGPRDCELVTHFLFDGKGKSTPVSFTLDAESLNEAIRPYLACRMDVKGIIHSHPIGLNTPSRGDLTYLKRLWARPRNRDTNEFFFPIVCNKQLFPYVVRPVEDTLQVVPAHLILV